VSRLQFADNTVLINFCLIGRLDLLERLMNGGGAWSATVQIECDESAHYPGCSALSTVHSFLGEPHRPETDEERATIQEAREFLREPGDGPEKHLGEAETVGIIVARSIAAILVTDDTGALRLARRHEVPAVTTADLLRLAARAGLIDVQKAWDYLRELQDSHKRVLPRAPESFADHLVKCAVVAR
jgi:predicted nucleic acid-binding protein